MKEYTDQLLKKFQGGDYKDFLSYVYSTFNVDSKKNSMRDKYLINRNRLLHYIVSNEKTIKAELCRK